MSKLKLFLNYQKHTFPYLNKIILSLLASIIVLVLALVNPLIVKALVDYAYPNRDVFLLTMLLLAGLGAFLVEQYFTSVSDYLDMYVDNSLSIQLRSKFYTKLQELSLSFHGEKQAGDLIFRMEEDISTVVALMVNFISTALFKFCQLGFLLFMCFIFDWRLTILALTGMPLYFIETKLFSEKRQAIVKKELVKQAGIRSHLQERIPAIKMIKSFRSEQFESYLFTKKIKELFLIIRESYIVKLLNNFTSKAIGKVWITIVGWYAGYHVITGILSIGELLAISVYIFQIYGPVMDIGDIYTFTIEGMISLERIDEVLFQKPIIEDAPDAEELQDARGSISFKNVSFSYSPGNPVLHALSFEIEPGKTVALVGPNGAGKTTITDLMVRFYDPQEGMVLIDGKDIKRVTQSSLRENITVVNQEITIFRGTIQENIQYGREGVNFEDIVMAAKMAHAHEFIEKLPDGYNSMVEERGFNLSGGQRQCLTLARAFLRNPRILILDEATSAIDPESEAQIHDAMIKFKEGKTAIIIAHKLSTIIDSDEIIFIENGCIVERGNFSELILRKGRFFLFFEMEFSNFRHFSEQLCQEILRIKRYRRPFSLMMLELRDLGKVASEIGVDELDAILHEAEEIIRKGVREVDFLTKYHRDRFLIGLPETDFGNACVIARRIEKIISTYTFSKSKKNIKFAPISGISAIGEDANSITELYRNSERMLEEKILGNKDVK